MTADDTQALIAEARQEAAEFRAVSGPNSNAARVITDLADRLSTALADLARMTEERKRWQDDYYRMDRIAMGERERWARAEAERDQALKDGATQAETSLHHEHRAEAAESAIATAHASGYAECREAAAKVADAYRERMEAAIVRHRAAGRSSGVAECKADAGESIAKDIRALATGSERHDG